MTPKERRRLLQAQGQGVKLLPFAKRALHDAQEDAEQKMAWHNDISIMANTMVKDMFQGDRDMLEATLRHPDSTRVLLRALREHLALLSAIRRATHGRQD